MADNLDVSLIKDVLRLDCEEICQDLNSTNLVGLLYSEGILNKEQLQHLKIIAKEYGEIKQARQLIEYVLDIRDETKVHSFITVLECKDPQVYYKIKFKIEEDNGAAELKWVQDIKENLVQVYHDKKYHIIHSLPGEKFILNLENRRQLMPFDFTTEKLTVNERIAEVFFDQNQAARYVDVKFLSLEKIFKCLQEENGSRLVLCTALAGCGKSVFVHSLVCQWLINCKDLAGFSCIFAISLREIDVTAPLLELLGCGRCGIGYIQHHMCMHFEKLLTHHKNASKILLILDGIDEVHIPNDSDLFKVISGEIMEHIKVFVTCRPESQIIRKFNPNYKVVIHGTTKDGIYNYLRHNLSVNAEAKQQEVEELLSNLQNNLMEFELLKVPLYLTLCGYVFNHYFAEHLTFKNFVMPSRTTMLFNVFINIIIRIWLEKLGRKDEAQQLQFPINPVNKLSMVPNDIKSKLVAFGRMSFDSLLKRQYTFHSSDIDEYLIQVQDISQSGLFCISKQHEDISVFFRHKQLQEYMAGLTLGRENFLQVEFMSKIEQKIRNSSTKLSLHSVFEDFQALVLFLFGLAPEIASKILQQLNNKICVYDRYNNESVDVHFESKLCQESSHEDVDFTMRKLLLTCKRDGKYGYQLLCPSASIQRFAEGFSTEQRVNILKMWYNFNIVKFTEPGNVDPGGITSMNISYLDEFLLFLLSKLKFNGINSVQVDRSNTLNVHFLNYIFPSVQKLIIRLGFPLLDEMPLSSEKRHGSLKEITFVNVGATVLPLCSIQGMLKQKNLESLRVSHVDILTNIHLAESGSFIQSLVNVELCILDIQDSNVITTMQNISKLLSFAPLLKCLTLGFRINKMSATASVTVIDMLHMIMLDKYETLTTLRLWKPFQKQHIEENLRIILSKICECSNITTIGLWWCDIYTREKIILEILYRQSQITTLQVLSGITCPNKATSVLNKLNEIIAAEYENFNVVLEPWGFFQS